MRPVMLCSLVALAACGGGSGGTPSGDVVPVGTSGQAVQAFMRAAADSNLTRMAQLWGNASGPAAVTGQPEHWERRIIVMQAFLRSDSSKVVSDVPVTGKDDQRRIIVALYRNGCMKQVPMTATRGRNGGWLVEQVDISTAGNPARPCEP